MLNPELKKIYTSDVIEVMEWMITQLQPRGINPIVYGIREEFKGVIAPYVFLWEGELDPDDPSFYSITGEALRMIEKDWTPYEDEAYGGFGPCYPKAAWADVPEEEIKCRLWV